MIKRFLRIVCRRDNTITAQSNIFNYTEPDLAISKAHADYLNATENLGVCSVDILHLGVVSNDARRFEKHIKI